MNTVVQPTSVTVDEESVAGIRMLLGDLEQALDAEIPDYKNILQRIHSMLQREPENVTVLQPEELAIVVRGLSKAKNMFLDAVVAKKAGTKKAIKIPANLAGEL